MMALLLYWSGQDSTGKFELMAPLYYYSQTPEEQVRVFLPFHYRYSSPESESNLWGPYFYKKTLRETSRFFFPLYFDHSTPESKTTFFVLYFRQKKTYFDSKLIFPLYWSFQPSNPNQKSYQTLIPFYFKIKGGLDKSQTILSPLFFSFKDSTVSQGFVPPYYWRHFPAGKTEIGFPLYWNFLRKKEDYDKQIQVAVPWFRYRTRDVNFSAFVPLYWGKTKISEEETSTTAAKVTQSQWHLFFPIFLSSQKPDGSSKIVTPLFSRFRDEDGKMYGHSGLSFFTRDVWGGKTEGLFPLFYYRQEPDFFKFRFLLFYLKKDKKEEKIQTSVFPLFRYQRDDDRKQFLTPLFYRDKDPDHSRGFFFPYFWSMQYQTDDPNKTLVSSKHVLFPLVWHVQSETQKMTVAPPLIIFLQRQDVRLSIIAPFYFDREKGNDRLLIIPPVISRRSPDRQWAGIFFVYWQSIKEGRSSYTFLPLFRKSVFLNGYSVLLPGFYFLREGDHTQGITCPYLWDHRGETQYEILAPLYWNFRRPSWQVKSFPPFYTLKTQRFKERGFFPLWAKTDSLEKSTGTAKHFLEDSHRLLPFYFYKKLEGGYDLTLPFLLGRIEKQSNFKTGTTFRGRLLLLCHWEKSTARFLNRFDPLYSYQRSFDKKGFSAPTAPFPLWQYEREGLDSDADKTVRGAFFPYYWKATKTGRRDFVFPVFYRRSEMDTEGKKEIARTTWLLVYYARQNELTAEKRKFVVPLYWSFTNKNEQRTILPPFWSERGPNYKKDIFFPLWWFVQRDRENLSVLFPFYVGYTNPIEERSMRILPGYWRRIDPEGSTTLAGLFFRKKSFLKKEATTIAFPVFWMNQSPEKTTFTVFPLLWRLKERSHSMTYFFPLYFQHRRANLDWKIVFPLFWKFKTSETEVCVIPPYFDMTSSDRRTRTTGFAPLWSYTRNFEQEWKNFQLFGGLIGFEKKGEKKRITLFYLITL